MKNLYALVLLMTFLSTIGQAGDLPVGGIDATLIIKNNDILTLEVKSIKVANRRTNDSDSSFPYWVNFKVCNSSDKKVVVWTWLGSSWVSDRSDVIVDEFFVFPSNVSFTKNVPHPSAFDPKECWEDKVAVKTTDGKAGHKFKLGFHPTDFYQQKIKPEVIWSRDVMVPQWK